MQTTVTLKNKATRRLSRKEQAAGPAPSAEKHQEHGRVYRSGADRPVDDENPCNVPADLELLEVAAPFDGERAPWLHRANRERYGVGHALRHPGIDATTGEPVDSWTISRGAARTKAEAMRDAKELLWDAPGSVAFVTSWPSGATRFYVLAEEDREAARAHVCPVVNLPILEAGDLACEARS